MRSLVWSSSFVRALRRKTRGRPDLRDRIKRTLRRLAQDPYDPLLHSHKLTGQLSGIWACTVSYDIRILFEFRDNPHSGEEEILLLTVGTHDEVY